MKELILQNAAEINRLHALVHLTYESKDQDEVKRKEWSKACAEFRDKYDRLAFPGGIDGAYEKILAGDPEAMEAAICFLECRPYYFRSGYMFKDILSKAKKAPLNQDQKDRLTAVIQRFDEYKRRRNERRQHWDDGIRDE